MATIQLFDSFSDVVCYFINKFSIFDIRPKMNFIRLCFSICFVISEIYGACDQPTFLQKYGIKRKPGSFRIVGGTPAEPGEFRGQVSFD